MKGLVGFIAAQDVVDQVAATCIELNFKSDSEQDEMRHVVLRYIGLMERDLFVNDKLTIPGRELSWTFSRSSGSGGQNVNKVETAVELSWSLDGSTVIGPFRKRRLSVLYQSRIVDGSLRVSVSEQRSQFQNRQIALKRLASLIREALQPAPPTRKATKPTRSSQRKRVETKKQRGAVKQRRQSRPGIDD